MSLPVLLDPATPDSARTEHLSPLLPGGVAPGIIAVAAGRARCGEVQRHLAPLAVVAGREIWCVDGANAFDPYAFSTLARQWGRDPRRVLERIRVTRTFTIHQMQAVARDLLPPLVRRRPEPLVLVLGIEHLFLEESLPLSERRWVLGRVLEDLTRLRAGGLPVLLTHDPPRRGDWWADAVRGVCDDTMQLPESEKTKAVSRTRAAIGGPPNRGRITAPS